MLYGGRGIKVCEEWKDNFKLFYDFCINHRWEKGLTIDRKNNNGNYEPSNIRFITQQANCQNRRQGKLTENKIRRIRYFLIEGKQKIKWIANFFNVAQPTISNIKNYKTWQNIK